MAFSHFKPAFIAMLLAGIIVSPAQAGFEWIPSDSYEAQSREDAKRGYGNALPGRNEVPEIYVRRERMSDADAKEALDAGDFDFETRPQKTRSSPRTSHVARTQPPVVMDTAPAGTPVQIVPVRPNTQTLSTQQPQVIMQQAAPQIIQPPPQRIIIQQPAPQIVFQQAETPQAVIAQPVIQQPAPQVIVQPQTTTIQTPTAQIEVQQAAPEVVVTAPEVAVTPPQTIAPRIIEQPRIPQAQTYADLRRQENFVDQQGDVIMQQVETEMDSMVETQTANVEVAVEVEPAVAPAPQPAVTKTKIISNAPELVAKRLTINPYPDVNEAPVRTDMNAITIERLSPHQQTQMAEPVPIPAPAPAQAESFEAISGFGSDIPLAIALQQVVPPSYGYDFGPDVNMGARASWSGGKGWDQVLQDMLRPLGLTARIGTKAIRIEQAAQEIQARMETPQPSVILASAMPSQFTAQSGDSLKRTIEGWAAQSNLVIDWTAPYDHQIQSDFVANRNFDQAVLQLIAQESAGNTPHGTAIQFVNAHDVAALFTKRSERAI